MTDNYKNMYIRSNQNDEDEEGDGTTEWQSPYEP